MEFVVWLPELYQGECCTPLLVFLRNDELMFTTKNTVRIPVLPLIVAQPCSTVAGRVGEKGSSSSEAPFRTYGRMLQFGTDDGLIFCL